jgi:hypothetical protein
LRRISFVVVLVVLMLALAGSAALADPPDGKGQPRAGEQKDTGKPNDPNCWGTTSSKIATTSPGSLGKHASSQEEPRQGVGNVARNDDAPGTRPSDHAALVGPQMGVSC